MFSFNKTTAALTLALLSCLPSISLAADWVLVANAKSSINKLDADAVGNLYLGKSTDLPGVGSVAVLDLPEGSTTRDSFYQDVTKKDASALKAYWARMIFTGKGQPPRAMDSAAAVKKAVAANPSAVGYIEKSAVDASVKVLLAL
ncbi:phosphate ABC transporter substrate-binding protein [Paucibacter sp. TC2R-5]|uniref:phosphate ABC transporter substrate-binding protein n=1 Tax=Paucibacter sp. TC2R-5 TaxID=2893555 RepID=UPI0021E4DDE9|nr:phosphate ABC transporter substrate-binding protein [Paucibacter sp. TC2R-5]MCV2359022.1 phosphate ABC transporter substrate-binding protein [Paucibacter sp. TC2R-5]